MVFKRNQCFVRMYLLCTVLVLTISTATAYPSWPTSVGKDIIGGSNAKSDRLYQVSLAKDTTGHFCGGAAVSDQYVVTAAHCLYREDLKKISVRAGSLNRKDGTVYQLDQSSVSIMPCYNDMTHDCDIAVFKVKTKFSNKIIRVKMADKEPADESFLTVTGWGLSGGSSSNLPDNLQLALIKKVQRSRCSARYDKINKITEHMICAGDESKNICKGDSGGPLVDGQGRLAGVVAWGAQDSAHTACSPSYPGVFTNVASPNVRDFLKKAVR